MIVKQKILKKMLPDTEYTSAEIETWCFEFGCMASTVRRNLRLLAEDGKIKKGKLKGKARVRVYRI